MHMSYFAYACKTEGKNGISHLISETAPFSLNICNGIIWGGAFSKAFRSSEALILVLSKNARLWFRSSEALILVLSKNARLYDNI